MNPATHAAIAQPGEPPRGETSRVLTGAIKVTKNLRVPMRDGVELALDLVRPDVPGPLPVVLMRTPYDKVNGHQSPLNVQLAQRGYIVALNDCRGRFNSDGVFTPYRGEYEDGYDTVEWIAAQDWCDGNVGMFGGSYAGQTCWYAASARPPHLKAIVPMCSPPSSLWRNEPLFNGCFMMCLAEWMTGIGARSFQIPDFVNTSTRQQPYFHALPFASLAERAGTSSRWWDEMMEHPVLDEFWRHGTYDNHAEMDVAALNVTGWWDLNFPGAPLNFEAMRASPAAARQKLVIGPWSHWINMATQLNGVDFGPNAVIDLNNYVIRFFDRWLKGIANDIEQERPVHVFVTGANEWWAADSWPLPGTAQVPFYFHSGGRANSLVGDGTLSREVPQVEPHDEYRYDPANPGITLWNIQEGPVDDRLATLRDDVLCYTSAPLETALDVVGWVTCRLYASSSALDTDWHVRLVDVHPDGSAHFLCRGALRARFRDSFEQPKLLEPGKPTLFELTMDACGIRFLPGHRIRVEVASSWFTRYDRNTNSGAVNFFKDDQIVVAEQRIYHERGMESCVLLPVVSRPESKRARR